MFSLDYRTSALVGKQMLYVVERVHEHMETQVRVRNMANNVFQPHLTSTWVSHEDEE